MRVSTYHGWTDVRYEDFCAVEPAIVPIREAFLAGKIDRVEVFKRVQALFGPARFVKDFNALFGPGEDYKHGRAYPPDTVQRWEAWLNEQPLSHRKLYYSPEVVTEAVIGKEKA